MNSSKAVFSLVGTAGMLPPPSPVWSSPTEPGDGETAAAVRLAIDAVPATRPPR